MSDSQELVKKIEMTREQAEDILHHVVVERIRWNKQYDGGDLGINKILDALIVIAHVDNDREAEIRKSLTLANRQLAAAGAREGKLKKKIAELTGKPVEDDIDEIE